MSSIQRFRPRLLLLILGGGLGVCLILFALGLVLEGILDPVTRSTDCGRVARAFADALRNGDARLARSLAVSDTGIDDWMSVRRGSSCPFSLDIDAYDAPMVCSYSNDDAATWSCGYHYLCRLGGWYLFRLDMIELEQTAEGCRVTQWSQPCEAFGEEVFD
jgi:hypothetical protein